jgi:hypothetical protein
MTTLQQSEGVFPAGDPKRRGFSRKRKLRYACLLIFLICTTTKFAVDYHLRDSGARAMDEPSGRTVALREHGVTVYVTSTESHALWLLEIGAWLFLCAALVIHANSPEEWR